MTSGAVKGAVRDVVTKWLPRLHLEHWSVGYEWDVEGVNVCSIKTDTPYERFILRFEETFPLSKNKETVVSIRLLGMDIERIVVHELCHPITNHLYHPAIHSVRELQAGKLATDITESVLDDADEKVTEWFAKCLWEAWERTPWNIAVLWDDA